MLFLLGWIKFYFVIHVCLFICLCVFKNSWWKVKMKTQNIKAMRSHGHTNYRKFFNLFSNAFVVGFWFIFISFGMISFQWSNVVGATRWWTRINLVWCVRCILKESTTQQMHRIDGSGRCNRHYAISAECDRLNAHWCVVEKGGPSRSSNGQHQID